jgi:ubiquinone/menaquinone biosynthesis C-methylase UbiE
MHSPEDEGGLREQIDYYRRRAPEYEETVHGEAGAGELRFESWLRRLAPSGEVLEIACGTGLWTRHLIGAAEPVTALDSSPEMIELARSRLGDAAVRFLVADFFRWRPDRRYDCAFFGFWLSHVPPQRFTDFWARVERCLAPGGRALFVDESAERGPRQPYRIRRSPYVERRLRDGSAFRIVKVFHEPDDLAAALGRLGWSARVELVEDGFLLGAAEPPAGTSD